MGIRRTEEFRSEAVRIALTSGLPQKQVTDDQSDNRVPHHGFVLFAAGRNVA